MIYIFSLFPVVLGVWWWLFGRETRLKQPLCLAGILGGVLTVGAASLGSYADFAGQTNDTEYWGGYVESATYEEDWDEEVPCQHPKYKTVTSSYECGTKDNPRTCTKDEQVQDGTLHDYDVDYHPPKWYFADSTGQTTAISEGDYSVLKSRFGNESFQEMNRHYHSNDGDAYSTAWNGNRATIWPVAREHTYTNRVQASRSTFKFDTVTPEEAGQLGLYEYPHPDGSGQMKSTLGPCPTRLADEIAFLNATMGGSKQIRIWLLTFPDQPVDTALKQESYWMGGNKNELVICVGLRKGKVDWCYPFSWTEQDAVTVTVRGAVMEERGKTFTGGALREQLAGIIQKNWKRKQFSDFDYLSIDTSSSSVLAAVLFSAAWCAGMVVVAQHARKYSGGLLDEETLRRIRRARYR